MNGINFTKRFLLACVALILTTLFDAGYLQAQHSVARQWNEMLLEAIRNDFARPTVHARNLWHTSTVMYDAWAAYDSTSSTCFLGQTTGNFTCAFVGIPTPSNVDSSRNEAISFAAYRLLKHRFQNSPGASESLPAFDSLMIALGYDTAYADTNYTIGNAASLGNYLAQCMINFGLQDGANEQNDYANIYYNPVNAFIAPVAPGNPNISDPNRWQPITLDVFIDQAGNVIPLNTPPFLSPEWGDVVPFAMDSADRVQYNRDGNNYWVYKDPGSPPYIDTTAAGGLTDEYKWGFGLVNAWSSHLDTADGVMWDISPASIGNVPSLPTDIPGLRNFYDFENGGDPSKGWSLNPKTGTSYQSQIISRADYTRVLAEFWADGPDSETPPGHWYTIANYVFDQLQFIKRWRGQGPVLDDLEWDVKAYLTLGGAVHDAAVAAWSIKGWYDYLRPISALRYMADNGQCTDTTLSNYSPLGIPLNPGLVEVVELGDPLAGIFNEHVGKIKFYTWRGPDYISNPQTDMAGVGWILAENWWPYQRPTFVTPPFAGYVSGHSTFSRAAAEVMTLMTGDAFFPGGMGEFIAPKNQFLVFEEGPSMDVTLQWATYRDASDQCSLSRIWGGIHPPADDIPGRVIGRDIGIDAFHHAENYFNPECTIQISDSVVNATCNSIANGAIYVSVSGNQSPVSYQWSTGDTSQNIINISSGLYTITVSDNISCTATLNVIVDEQDSISATIFTGSATTFCGATGALLKAHQNSNYTYQWHRYNNPISGATNLEYNAKQSGPHYCVITDTSTGCADTSNIITTTRLSGPVALINESSPIEICGESGTPLTTSAFAGYTYQWLRYGNAAPGMNTDTTYALTKRGNYKVRVTDTNGCSTTSGKVVVIKNQVPNVIVDQPGPLSQCIGDTVVLKSIATRGTPPYVSYQWSRYSTVLTGQTADSILVTTTGGYSVRIYDTKGCTDKSPRTVVNYSSCPRLGTNGINDSEFILNVFPNPFKETLNVTFTSSSAEEIMIRVVDVIGREVYRNEYINTNTIQINSALLNSGLYQVEAYQAGKYAKARIIK